MKANILIIDDDAKLNQLLVEFLRDFGFKAVAATRPEEGLRKLKQEAPDLIILDVMLPGMSGFEVCKTIRQSHAVPIIMLTARGEVTDKVVGLELGADDYLPKPFEPFYRVDKSRSKDTGGYGLGLSLCKTVMEAHHGRIEVDSSPNRGTTVSLFFPHLKNEEPLA